MASLTLLNRASMLLDAIAATLWPGGTPDAEWDADTLTAIADLMRRAGYEPAAIPTCDLYCKVENACGQDDCYLCAGDWNGETGNHRSCERDAVPA